MDKINHSNEIENFFIKQLIICIIFWSLSILFESLYFSYLSSVYGVYIGSYFFYKILNNNSEIIRFLSIGCATLIFVTNIAWIYSGYYSYEIYNLNIFENLNFTLNIDPINYMISIIYILFFTISILLFSKSSKLKNYEVTIYNEIIKLKQITISKLNIIFICSILIELYLINLDFFKYRSVGIDGYNWYVELVEILIYFHAGMIGLGLNKIFNGEQNKRLLLSTVISVLILSFIFFTRGRTNFGILFFYIFFWYCLFNFKTPKIKYIIMILLISIPFFSSAFQYFNFLRGDIVYSSLGNLKNKENFLSTSINYLSVWKLQEVKDIEKYRTGENLSSRPLLAEPLARSIQLDSSEKIYGLGRISLNNLIWTVPRLILPNKNVIAPAAENNLYKYMPIHDDSIDTHDSLYWYSYAEFSYFGLIIFPFLLFLYWKLIAQISSRYFKSIALMLVLTFFLKFFVMYFFTSSMITWFIGLRNFFIFIPVILLIQKLIGKIEKA